jgi:hypothetical protein
VTTPESVQASIVELASHGPLLFARQARIAAPLLSSGRRIVEGSYAGAYGTVGTTGAGLFGRLTLGQVSLLGGVGYGEEGESGAGLRRATTIAGALRYVRETDGRLRPFAEAGGWVAPNARFSLARHYANGAGTATGTGRTEGDVGYYYLRLGLALVGSAGNELALSAEVGRSRLDTDSYVEPLSNANPFEAHVAHRDERMTVYRLRGQYSHALVAGLDATLWAHAVWADPTRDGSGVVASVPGIGTLGAFPGKRSWAELGARLGYDVARNFVVEIFADGNTGEKKLGDGLQAGLAVRVRF